MTTTGDSGSRQELTTELAALDRQLRDLSEQWEAVERTISEKTRRRRELIARQEETNEDHAEEINRLQSDVYALRDRLDQLLPPRFQRPLPDPATGPDLAAPPLPSPRWGGRVWVRSRSTRPTPLPWPPRFSPGDRFR